MTALNFSFTGDALFEEKAFNVSKHLHSLPKENHLVPMFISTETGRFGNDQTITLGARADSYYEYLLKQWIQTGMKEDFLKQDYLKAMEAAGRPIEKLEILEWDDRH